MTRLEAQLKTTLALLVTVCFFLAASAPAQTAIESLKSAIEHVLLTQQDAWNHHDLDAFMTGYWNSPDLTFFSGAKESKGWQATIDRYRATYTSAGKEMGQLQFSELRIEPLGSDAAFVRERERFQHPQRLPSDSRRKPLNVTRARRPVPLILPAISG